MASIKGNIILNGINTITGIIFPIITFPYAARVLMPDGIGAVNFLNSVIGYIVLLTSLGIPMYAVKEVAKYRDDKIKRDQITIEIILLSILLCLIGYVVVCLLAEFIPQIHQQAALFYILSLTIVFTAIGVNWFYQGIEDFKFITIRAIVIRTLAATALFIFVKNQTDLLIYGIITVGSTVGNNIINFIHLRKHINCKFIRLRDLNIFRHLRPALQVFILNLIISLYVQLNSIMLGFMSGDEAVGYFTAGTKISHIGLTVICSIGTVLLPRCSHLIKIGDFYKFKSIVNRSLSISIALSLPITFGLIILSKPIVLIFCGANYENTIPILCLNAPIIILGSLTNVMGVQILYPMDKIKVVIYGVSGGAILNILFNVLLIPIYNELGAAISALIAEIASFIIQLICGRKYYPFKIQQLFYNKYIVASVFMGFIMRLFCDISISIINILICISIGIFSYIVILAICKDELIMWLYYGLKKYF